MNTRTQPPPKPGMGCLAKGCLTLTAVVILLVAVGIGGSVWSLRHVYLSDKPVPLPEPAVPSEPTAAATPVETTPASPTPTGTTAAVRERLDTIKQAARAHERTGVELTAADINVAWLLLASTAMSRGFKSPFPWKDWTFPFETHLVWVIGI
ncbi:MAG: hypothetical protein DME65_11245 [Verrucomicrobia bacterium]|nr:MAG: hypothetical protein DME65_11245 [Verrucomicrobiota bacterium]